MFRFAGVLLLSSLMLLPSCVVAAENEPNGNTSTSKQAEAESAGNPATSPANWTNIVVETVAPPRPFAGSEGQNHLCYELRLTNYSIEPAVLKAVTVLDADDKSRQLRTLSGDELAANMTILDPDRKPFVIHPGGTALVWVNVDLHKTDAMPRALDHEIEFEQKMDATVQTKKYTAARLSVDNRPPVRIASPLKGKGWIAAGGYVGQLGHRRALFPLDNKLQCSQRYAIDWMKMDDKGFMCTSDPAALTSSPCYGQPVYAVADGVVMGVVDKFPDQPQDKASGDRYFPGGNSIIIDLGNGAYAFYAHLKPGSPLVKEGDKVKRGQQIGVVGNSGNSSGPHLHFHIADRPSPLAANSIPYEFESFEMVGEIPIITDCDNYAQVQKPVPYHKLTPTRHTNELIREGSVVNFEG